MKSCDIIETIVSTIEKTIFKEWRHEGFIDWWNSDSAIFDIDGKEYVLNLKDVEDGEHFSEKMLE